MKSFTFKNPKAVNKASDLLVKNKNAIPFAGGTDALGLMKENVYQPDVVVNLKKIPGIDGLEYKKGDGLYIDALWRVQDLIDKHPEVSDRFPILKECASVIASPQLRNIGTVGGNLCQRPRCWYYRGEFDCLKKGGDMCYAFDGENKFHCVIGGGPCYIVHPSDLAVAFTALEAEVFIENNNEKRTIPIAGLYHLPEEDVTTELTLQQGDILTGVKIPDVPSGTKSGYIKIMERGSWDFAVVSIAAVLKMNGKKVESGRIAFGGVAPVPWLDENVTTMLTNFSPTESNIKKAAQEALKDAEPLAQNGYKIQLAKNLVTKLLTDLTA